MASRNVPKASFDGKNTICTMQLHTDVYFGLVTLN